MRAAARRLSPRLEGLEQRLPPGDALWGILLGWGAMSASDAAFDAAGGPAGSSQQSRLVADLDGPDGLPALTEYRRSAGSVRGALPRAGQAIRPEQEPLDPVSSPSAPASRLLAETPGSASVGDQTAVTAPAGPGHLAPAFAAVAGAVPRDTPSNLAAPAPRPTAGGASIDRTQALNNLSRSALSFEANAGQTDARVNYLARTGSGTVFLTPTAAIFAIQGSGVRGQESAFGLQGTEPEAPSTNAGVALYMDIVGANPAGRAAGVNPLPGKVNYFIGNDPSNWHTNIPTFGRVEYPNVYAGISLAYYGGPNGLEYDFTLAPGSDPRAIALKFEGADGVGLDSQGDLVVHTAAGHMVQHAPVVYQDAGGQRQPVAGHFALDSGVVRFDVGPYDHTRPLVIDPLVLGYSTYLGGSSFDAIQAVAADASGDSYVGGDTQSSDFPTTPGAFQATFHGGHDAFVAKLSADGAALLYSTYLGGSNDDSGSAIAVDGAGNAYLGGYTASKDFPVTPGAFQTMLKNTGDGFVTKLNASGSALAYSTFLSGSGGSNVWGIAVDAVGRAYVTGATPPGFPTTPGAFQTQPPPGQFVHGFVAKLNPTGTALAYGTYLAGNGSDEAFGVAVDGAGDAFVTGWTKAPGSGVDNFPTTPGAFDTTYNGGYDGFAAELNAPGSALVYGSFLGGSQEDEGFGIAVDGAGGAYVTGKTTSADFPATPGAFDTTYNGGYDGDAFVAKVAAGGSALAYATFLGGTNSERGLGIAVPVSGQAYVTGYTGSADFPTTPGALQGTYQGVNDGFLTRLSPDGGALAYSTFLGGSSYDHVNGVAVDGAGAVYVAGWTESPNFPTTPGAFSTTLKGDSDAFVAKFCNGPCRVPAEQHAVSP
jgi:hypothetical protein